MERAAVPQVSWRALREGDDPASLDPLGLPLFVKPARLGSSVGISKVSAPEELAPALELALRARPARDRGVDGLGHRGGVLGARRRAARGVSSRARWCPKNDWYDYEAKYTDGGMELVVPGSRSETGFASGCASWR